MKRLILVLTLLVALSLSAVAAPVASAVDFNQWYSGYWEVQCVETGEFVGVQWTVHEVYNEVAQGSGGVHISGHYNSKGVGTGLSSGNTYEWRDAWNYFEQIGPGDTATVKHEKRSSTLTSANGTCRFEFFAHRTINANGVVTVFFYPSGPH